MRIPSRLMPKYQPRRPSWYAWLFLAVIASALAYFLVAHAAATLAVLVAFASLILIENWRFRRHMAKLVASRRGESICEFARSFDARTVDPWVVRAVYEQIQAHLRTPEPLPIRADDLLARDLRLDDDDLDMDLAPQIAQRTGRSLAATKRNPYFGKVKSASDLVMFFNEQPKGVAT